MSKTEFDNYADSYEDLHAKSVDFSGEDIGYFAEYKIKEISRVTRSGAGEIKSIIDFGSGIGKSNKYWKEYFPYSNLTNSDVSEDSLHLAKMRSDNENISFMHITEKITAADSSYNIVFSSCVFHHINENDHLKWLKELHRVTSQNGRVFIFEHNPINPLTRKAVRDCPFDEGVILIPGKKLKSLMQDAGFSNVKLKYTLFFPKVLSFLKIFEPYLWWLPIGAQYYIEGEK